MKIILLTGVIGSGKDFYAEEYTRLNPTEKIKHLHFAGTLRDITEGMFNIPKGDDKAYTEFKSVPENRKFMVDLGQNLKRVYGENFFAEKIANTILNEIGDNKDLEVRCIGVDGAWVISDDSGEAITYLVSDFRFPVEFWTMYSNFQDKLEIVFCDYHSDRYELRPEQESEQMAIWLLSKGLRDREKISVERFIELMREYEINK